MHHLKSIIFDILIISFAYDYYTDGAWGSLPGMETLHTVSVAIAYHIVVFLYHM